MGKPNSFFIASGLSSDDGYSADLTNPTNYYAILDSSQGLNFAGAYFFDSSTVNNSAISPVELLSLEKKIDDGISISGNILSGSMGRPGGATVGGIIATTPLGACSNGGGVYQVQNSGYTCTPLIRIGGYAGDPQ